MYEAQKIVSGLFSDPYKVAEDTHRGNLRFTEEDGYAVFRIPIEADAP